MGREDFFWFNGDKQPRTRKLYHEYIVLSMFVYLYMCFFVLLVVFCFVGCFSKAARIFHQQYIMIELSENWRYRKIAVCIGRMMVKQEMAIFAKHCFKARNIGVVVNSSTIQYNGIIVIPCGMPTETPLTSISRVLRGFLIGSLHCSY